MKPGSVIIDISAPSGGNCEATVLGESIDINGTTVWASGALADDDEICYRRPITLRLGLEY